MYPGFYVIIKNIILILRGTLVKVVIAIDSFKGSVSSFTAGNAAKEGVLRAIPDANVEVFCLSDGGEGMMQAMLMGKPSAKRHSVYTKDPLMRNIVSEYAIMPDGTVIIESASCCGMGLLDTSERDPLFTTTFGLGIMILDAIERGFRNFTIGLGGSATNDCGMGMLAALGYRFYIRQDEIKEFVGKNMCNITYIDASYADKRLLDCSFKVACDVSNPLLGENGAAHVFARQKGASDNDISILELGAKRFTLAARDIAVPNADIFQGAGAAGGLGYAFLAILNAQMVSGADVILNETILGQAISNADIFITGEGRMDRQTLMGKAPIKSAKFAKKYGVFTIGIAGSLDISAISALNEAGLDVCISIQHAPCSLKEALQKQRTCDNISACIEQIMRAIAQKNRS